MVRDRGGPPETVLAEMRGNDPPVQYLVGTPKGRLSRLEKHLLRKPWQDAREGVKVKLLAQDGELYVFAQSADRVTKERAMRRRKLKWLWKRLQQIAAMEIEREELLMKLGAARSGAPAAWRLVDIEVDKQNPSFTFSLNRKKLRKVRRREGRYLLRTNLTDNDPARPCPYTVQPSAVEHTFPQVTTGLAPSAVDSDSAALSVSTDADVAATSPSPGFAPVRNSSHWFAKVRILSVYCETGTQKCDTESHEPDAACRILTIR